jgi:hypothetical protein
VCRSSCRGRYGLRLSRDAARNGCSTSGFAQFRGVVPGRDRAGRASANPNGDRHRDADGNDNGNGNGNDGYNDGDGDGSDDDDRYSRTALRHP